MRPFVPAPSSAGPSWPLPGVRFGDMPVVLAFADSFALDGASDADLAIIRAELRGLGAALVVVSTENVWHFRPDDDVERLEPARGDTVAALVRRYGVPRAADGRLVPALFVLDPDGTPRFEQRSAAGGDDTPMHAVLAEGLRAAGRAMVARQQGSATDAVVHAPALLSRREWVLGMLVSGLAAAFSAACDRSAPGPAARATADASDASAAEQTLDVVLHVNGTDRKVRIDPRVSLLDALRERMGLTGSKKGCDHGQCGACTVLVDDRRVCSCLTLAIMVQGKKVTTIEGLARGDELHAVQSAFVEHDAFQCGYCTPGQIMSAVGMLAEGHAHTDDEVREQMSGNICRCGAYPNIVAAIQSVRGTGSAKGV